MEMLNPGEWRAMETRPVTSEAVNEYMMADVYTFEIRMALFIAVAAAELSNIGFEESLNSFISQGK
jgi:hypothetical protein